MKIEDGLKVSLDILYILEEILLERRRLQTPNSYSVYLFSRGLPKILDKLGEEVAELIVAARHRVKRDIVHEAADVIFHLMILMVFMRISLDDVLPAKLSEVPLEEVMSDYDSEDVFFFTGVMEAFAKLVFISSDYDNSHEKYKRLGIKCRQIFYCVLLLCNFRQVKLHRIMEELKTRMKEPKTKDKNIPVTH